MLASSWETWQARSPGRAGAPQSGRAGWEPPGLEREQFMARRAESSRKQAFRFTAPDAQSVLLVGDFTHWQQNAISMRRGKDGVWTTSVDLPPGTHHYRFIVDGEWTDDPDCTMRVANPFGSENMVRQVA